MKCRFYLLDLSEGEWEKKPCVRLWGVDDRGLRVLISRFVVRLRNR
jgi:hypothetical protein